MEAFIRPVISYFLQIVPVIFIIIVFAVKLEARLTRIETNIQWLCRSIPGCQQTSEDPLK